ncbi:hypothetical protein ACHAWO_011415 [Cyclotella atomus]|uniref:Uncharacterized protein n=1 Tax=Cyclotella atomus TaxID=382360 RepID=A0ABD3NF82_9STRA
MNSYQSLQFDPEESDSDSHNNPRRGRPGIVVFSGGTAFNAASAEMASRIIEVGIADATDNNDAAAGCADGRNIDLNISRENSLVDVMTLGSFGTEGRNLSPERALKSSQPNVGIAVGTKVWHVLPVTDDGGSTAEIVRVLGGPAVGDIRSRLLRLAPGTTNEARAVRRLLGHRLISMESWKKKHPNEHVDTEQISKMAREEWLDILEGYHEGTEHRLWKEVSTPYRSIIRSFLVHFHAQVLQTHNGLRHSQSSPPFDFTGGSVGNFFFAGARTFFGSLPAAIFLFSKVAEVPTGSRVLPAVLTEDRLVLGAELKNRQRIRGQYNISHPSASNSSSGHRPVVKSGKMDSKEDKLSLHPSPISRIAYLLHDPTWQRKNQNSNDSTKTTNDKTTSKSSSLNWNDRHEINPDPNPLVLDAISNANCIVYGCGSLFTSVIPSLVLPGVGEAIADSDGLVPKILLLNGWHDRETSWSELEGNDLLVKKMDATACVKAIVNALDQGGRWSNFEDTSEIEQSCDFDNTSRLQSPPLVTDYITHVLYPIGTEIELDEQSLLQYCQLRESICESYNRQQSSQSMYLQQQFPTPSKSNRQIFRGNESIKFIGVQSIPANTCTEGSRSGGQPVHRIFHPPSLVDMILDLANGGSRPREAKHHTESNDEH